MMRFVLVCALALCFAVAVYAQGYGNSGGEMTITQYGVFVLKNAALAKFDAATLRQQGAALELFGTLPEQPPVSTPPTDQERQAVMAWNKANAMRMSPAAMLAKGDELLIVMNNVLFRVNQRTLTLDTTQPKLLAADTNPQSWMKPVLELNANTLYILIGFNMVAVNADTAAVLSNGVLPKEMTPKQNMGIAWRPNNPLNPHNGPVTAPPGGPAATNPGGTAVDQPRK